MAHRRADTTTRKKQPAKQHQETRSAQPRLETGYVPTSEQNLWMLQRRVTHPAIASPQAVQALQRAAGNRAVLGLIQPSGTPASSAVKGLRAQTKLTGVNSQQPTGSVQRKEGNEGPEEQESTQADIERGRALAQASLNILEGAEACWNIVINLLQAVFPLVSQSVPPESWPALMGPISGMTSGVLSHLSILLSMLVPALELRKQIPGAYLDSLFPHVKQFHKQLDAQLTQAITQKIPMWLGLTASLMAPGSVAQATQLLGDIMPAHAEFLIAFIPAKATIGIPLQHSAQAPPAQPVITPSQTATVQAPQSPSVPSQSTTAQAPQPPAVPSQPTTVQAPRSTAAPPQPASASATEPEKPITFFQLRQIVKSHKGEENQPWTSQSMWQVIERHVQAVKKCYKAWQESKARGDPPEAQSELEAKWRRFIEWLRRQDILIEDDGTIDLKQFAGGSRKVEYVRDVSKQRESMIHFGGGRLWHDPEKTKSVDTDPMVTHFSGPGFGIFVMGESGDFHIGSHKVGRFHHSSLLAGTNVAGAGEVKVSGGTVKFLSSKSGHYMPTEAHLKQVLYLFQKRGISLDFQLKAWVQGKKGIEPKLFSSANDYLAEPGRASYKEEKDAAVVKYFTRKHGQICGMAYQAAGWNLKWQGSTPVPVKTNNTKPTMKELKQALRDHFKEQGQPEKEITRA